MTANQVKTGSFAKPVILKASISPGFVLNETQFPFQSSQNGFEYSEHSSVEKVNVLYSSSGARYELGRVLKKAIFGVVLHATLLSPLSSSAPTSPHSPDTTTGSSAPPQSQFQQSKSFIRTNVSFAIKIYSKEMILSHAGRSKENPLIEIAAMQELGDHHPHLMGQVECCADDLYLYSVMRFCPGGELFDTILTNGRLSEAEARGIFRQLISALTTLEERGMAHLDISLENILYHSQQQQITVIDFGMVTKLTPSNDDESKRRPGSRRSYAPIRNNYCGKKNYMAPEIIADQPLVDAIACDIWSAGICLLYLLLGFPPLEVASFSDLRFVYLMEGKLSHLFEHWEVRLSREVIDLIEGILRIDPQQRLTSQQILAHPWMTMNEGSPVMSYLEKEKAGLLDSDHCMVMEESKSFTVCPPLTAISSPSPSFQVADFYARN